MTFTSDHILVFLIAVAIGVSAYFAGRKFTKLESDRDAAIKEAAGLAHQLEEVKTQVQDTGRSYKELAGLMDGIAVLMDIKQEAQSTLDYFDRRTEQLMTILRTIRRNPEDYDPDRPNGKEDRRRH